jgi:hypothetical protein
MISLTMFAQALKFIGRRARLVSHPAKEFHAACRKRGGGGVHLLKTFDGAGAADQLERAVAEFCTVGHGDDGALIRRSLLHLNLLACLRFFEFERRAEDFAEQCLDGFVAKRTRVRHFERSQHFCFALGVIMANAHRRMDFANLLHDFCACRQQVKQIHVDLIDLSAQVLNPFV